MKLYEEASPLGGQWVTSGTGEGKDTKYQKIQFLLATNFSHVQEKQRHETHLLAVEGTKPLRCTQEKQKHETHLPSSP